MSHRGGQFDGGPSSSSNNGGFGYPGSNLTFASRAKAAKAALEAHGRIAPPPGFSAPPASIPRPTASSSSTSRGRVPSPSFYGALDGRARRHGATKPLLPITPSLAPDDSVITPPSASPIPRTPSPPPVQPISQLPVYRQPAGSEGLSKNTINGSRSFPLPSATASNAPSTTRSAPTEKRKRNVIRRKTSAHHTSGAKDGGLRTGSTSSADASTSVTTSTSTSYTERDVFQQPSILGISAPMTSYTSSSGLHGPPPSSYFSRNYGASKHAALSSGIQPPNVPRNRSGSGSLTQPASPPASNRLSIPSISSHLAKSVPRLSTSNLPPPITVPASHSDNTSTSSPSTACCGSPGMFSYTSTPTSSSTNPSSIQSPGFNSANLRARNASPTRPNLARNKSAPGAEVEAIASGTEKRRKNSIGGPNDKNVTHSSKSTIRVSTTSNSSTSTVRPDNSRRSISMGSTSQISSTKTSSTTPKHTRTSSKESNGSKTGSGSTFGGFHFRKSSKDISSLPTPSSASHSRKSSRDSSIQSPSSASNQGNSYFPSSAPIPIPNAKGKTPPVRPSREGQPDITGDGTFKQEIPVIQSGIIKDPRSKTPKMVTSSSLPQRRNAPTVLGATPPATSLSTSTPGRSKSVRAPTSSTGKATKVVHGFSPGVATSSGPSTSRSVESSPKKKKDEKKIDIANAPPPSKPSFLSSRSRTKTVPGPASETKPNVLRRPGPAAGTGHEGYSQFAKQTRTRSVSGSALPTPSTSKVVPKSSSASSTPNGSLGKSSGAKLSKAAQVDDFLQDRQKPVVIQGGGVIQNKNSTAVGGDILNSGAPQTGQLMLPGKKLTKPAETKKGSLEMPRNMSAQGSRSLDLPRPPDSKASTQQKEKRPVIQRTLSGNSDKSDPQTEDFWPDSKESWLKAPKHLGPPQLAAPKSPKPWTSIFQKSKSAPDVTKEPTKKALSPAVTAKTSPPMPGVKFGDENRGGYIQDVHSPPLAESSARRASRGYTANMRKQQHVHSVLLPEPPLLTSTQKQTPTSKSKASPMSPPGKTLASRDETKSNLPHQPVMSSKTQINPRTDSLPRPAQPQPQPQHHHQLPHHHQQMEIQDLHFIIPDLDDPSKTTSIKAPPGLPIPRSLGPAIDLPPATCSDCQRKHAAVHAKSLEDIAKREVRNATALDRINMQFEEDFEDDSEVHDSSDELENPASPFSSESDTRPSTSGPTPSPGTTPRRARLEAIGRIPTPKSQKAETSTLKLPTLADILPPPPENPNARQPIKIHPVKRIAQPQPDDSLPDTYTISPSDERQDPFANLPPLIITDDMANKQAKKRLSESTDDWNEYDDYLDEMTGTPKSCITHSNTSSMGVPFPYTALAARFNPAIERERKGKERAIPDSDSPTIPSQAVFPVFNFAPSNKKRLVLDKSKLVISRPLASIPSLSPAPPTSSNKSGGLTAPIPDVDSARSSSSYGATTPGIKKTIAFADFVAAYGDSGNRIMSVVDPLQEKGKSSPHLNVGLLSPMSSNTDFEDDSNSDDESARLSIISALPGTEEALEGEMKVRLWAMMTSRWLSFGRVLVSPAHEEVRAATSGSRILVVDGLRNDDWSFYCSLNYSSAAIYNLTPSQAPSPKSPAGETQHPPPNNPTNHHQIHHVSFASPFPFPIGFFSVVCLRFLPVYEDSLWPFIISQCMRVLKPGGYIELSVMDMDMLNSGPRTKRNIDAIKETLQLRKPGSGTDWFKKSPSDKALRVLATRGFTDITRCWVGLPSVGNLDGSREETASMQQLLKEEASDEVDVSSPEGRNRVVSKVGRWWYSKCFEDYPVDEEEENRPKFVRSLWEDKTLLRECEKKKTSFRMMMSFAKKPLDWKDY